MLPNIFQALSHCLCILFELSYQIHPIQIQWKWGEESEVIKT